MERVTDTGAGAIGARVRAIRRRRGLSLSVAAGLAGISKSYLSRLESGERAFTRRGLVEDLAYALGCSPVDLTGTPVLVPDRRSLAAASTIPALTAALHDVTLDDVPDMPTRPLAELVDLAERAHAAADDEMRFDVLTGSALADVIVELHVLAATGSPDERRTALEALVRLCIVAMSVAAYLGHLELALTVNRCCWDAVTRLGRLDMLGIAATSRAIGLNRVGARRRAQKLLGDTLGTLGEAPGPTSENTSVAEAAGMLHLASAQMAARDGRLSEAETHLAEAADLARYTGERNFLRFHFGPANVGAWQLAVAVETGRGPERAEQLERVLDLSALGSAERRVAVHFDFARAYAQAEGARDAEALRHIDRADRIAPLRIRHDPLARELVTELDRRARRKVWELSSLKNRIGVA
ncbi:MAG TPA: helix-turn-helix transcriptional regulator [Pseudonocardia sp.]|nr:helix-turn-helix transcriptional regulator [Pseudonocardia sp.]